MLSAEHKDNTETEKQKQWVGDELGYRGLSDLSTRERKSFQGRAEAG
jgi:hypothetical protein